MAGGISKIINSLTTTRNEASHQTPQQDQNNLFSDSGEKSSSKKGVFGKIRSAEKSLEKKLRNTFKAFTSKKTENPQAPAGGWGVPANGSSIHGSTSLYSSAVIRLSPYEKPLPPTPQVSSDAPPPLPPRPRVSSDTPPPLPPRPGEHSLIDFESEALVPNHQSAVRQEHAGIPSLMDMSEAELASLNMPPPLPPRPQVASDAPPPLPPRSGDASHPSAMTSGNALKAFQRKGSAASIDSGYGSGKENAPGRYTQAAYDPSLAQRRQFAASQQTGHASTTSRASVDAVSLDNLRMARMSGGPFTGLHRPDGGSLAGHFKEENREFELGPVIDYCKNTPLEQQSAQGLFDYKVNKGHLNDNYTLSGQETTRAPIGVKLADLDGNIAKAYETALKFVQEKIAQGA